MTVDYPALIIEQLEYYWDAHLWPRVQGLTDEEYLWEPASGSASVRLGPGGVWAADATPEDDGVTPPVTTIAWRIEHLVGNMGRRANRFFDTGVPFQAQGTAAGGLRQLESAYQTWMSMIRALDDEALRRPLGAKGGPYAADPMIALIVHVSRETMHHGGEIGVLRDLYRAGVR